MKKKNGEYLKKMEGVKAEVLAYLPHATIKAGTKPMTVDLWFVFDKPHMMAIGSGSDEYTAWKAALKHLQQTR